MIGSLQDANKELRERLKVTESTSARQLKKYRLLEEEVIKLRLELVPLRESGLARNQTLSANQDMNAAPSNTEVLS